MANFTRTCTKIKQAIMFGNFSEQVDQLKKEERKQYLKGVVDKIDVNLNTKTNIHTLKIKFQFPIVDD